MCSVPGGEVVQAGVDVLAVIIHLLRVEGALAVQTVQRLSEFDQLRLTPLTIHSLVTDVLHTHTHSRPSAHTHTHLTDASHTGRAVP